MNTYTRQQAADDLTRMAQGLKYEAQRVLAAARSERRRGCSDERYDTLLKRYDICLYEAGALLRAARVIAGQGEKTP
jgi:hypothetical protein